LTQLTNRSLPVREEQVSTRHCAITTKKIRRRWLRWRELSDMETNTHRSEWSMVSARLLLTTVWILMSSLLWWSSSS